MQKWGYRVYRNDMRIGLKGIVITIAAAIAIVMVGVVVLIGVPTQQVVREFRASDIIRVRRYEDDDDDDLGGVMDMGGRERGSCPHSVSFAILLSTIASLQRRRKERRFDGVKYVYPIIK